VPVRLKFIVLALVFLALYPSILVSFLQSFDLFFSSISFYYCDVDGVRYATASKIYVTSDVSVATQRIRIPKQPNC
jgi:hypothetical protein